MTRILADYVYGDGPRDECWWSDTIDIPDRPVLVGAHHADVAIIGGGFTGISAALHLAQSGVKVVVLEQRHIGWGASGRNGGFCCLGGGMLGNADLDAQFGRAGRRGFRTMERAAVELVDGLIGQLGMAVDQHSTGETQLAHRPKDMQTLRERAADVEEDYGVSPILIEKSDLVRQGMAGPFFGGLTIPIGFALNPLKYLMGLTAAAQKAGAAIFHNSPVLRCDSSNTTPCLTCENGTVKAEQVIFATNGYSSEDLPEWLAGRYMPAQSNVLVTRPLSQREIDQQGWTTSQMSFDTRHLLHYFRLMPDRRFLFGMRGALLSGSKAEARARRRVRSDFNAMFPAWSQVETSHQWSGLVCLARNRQPYVGAVPDRPGFWAGLSYHGNGVAMASLSGKILADLILGRQPEYCLDSIQRPLEKFPFGRSRRLVLPPVYAGLKLADR